MILIHFIAHVVVSFSNGVVILHCVLRKLVQNMGGIRTFSLVSSEEGANASTLFCKMDLGIHINTIRLQSGTILLTSKVCIYDYARLRYLSSRNIVDFDEPIVKDGKRAK